MEEVIRFIMEDAAPIAQAILAILGGARVISRYTPWKGDDKFFEKMEAGAKKAASYLPKKKDK